MTYFRVAGIIMLVIAVAAVVFIFFPGFSLHKEQVGAMSKKFKIVTLAVAVLTILLCVLPMGMCDLWNGKQPDHRNQYELTAEAILDGHLNIEYDDYDARLEQMENPYDPYARRDQGIPYHWDHSFYKGKYYMYFGVVPVFLLFLPFRALFGVSLPAFIATAIFITGFIAGIFALFRKLAKLFFPEMSVGAYLFLSAAMSVMSSWYCTATPAMYCTAISAAMCMMIWCLYFFISAVWGEYTLKKAIILAFCGSVFGALSFGCRPVIALANIIAVPMIVVFIKKRGFSKKLLGGLAIAAIPYIVIGALLMIYNYVRFESPFEFGLTYQLTAVDVTKIGLFSDVEFFKTVGNMLYYLVGCGDLKKLAGFGTLITFPIVLYIVISLCHEPVRKRLKEEKLSSTLIVMLILVPIMVYIAVAMCPFLVDRYRLDYVWLLGVATFICIGFLFKEKQNKEGFSKAICIWSLITIEMSIVLFLWPHNWNYTFVNYADNIDGVINKLKTLSR